MGQSKTFAFGIIVGGLLVGTAAYAADTYPLSVKLPNFSYFVDGAKQDKLLDEQGQYLVNEQAYPLTIQYKGVNYVPIRYLTESLHARTTFDPATNSISIDTSEEVPFEIVQPEELSGDLQNWVERSLPRAMTQYRQMDGYTYILITQGRKTTGGYGVSIERIRRFEDGAVAYVSVNDPKKGDIAITKIMFPYALVRVEGELKGPLSAKATNGGDVPALSGTSYIYEYYQESEDFLLFKPFVREGTLVINGIVRSFDGLVGFRLSSEEGQTIVEDSIKAIGSAPDWAYFSRIIPLEELDETMQAELWIYSGNEEAEEQVMQLQIGDWLR